ncbi:MAG: hypothetical protein CMP59_02885 [Flavobacteriales bacterium]|nr:hypothetical protein [Flavobacteriales bacterium]|tara:strand:+ start:1206 stop:1562 length:357 start_codon:yes stop_codon:yes gene_type:complete
MQHSEHFKSLSEEAKEYIENRVELVRLEAMDHSSFLFANITAYIILAGTLLLFLISFCFFAGSWLGELLGSLWAGFAIVAGFYLILFLLLIWKFTTWVSNPIQNFLIQKMEEYHADED